MKLTNKQTKALEAKIQSFYDKHANGRQIKIMNIGKLFKQATEDALQGMDLEMAVKNAIESYCVKAS